MNDKNFIEELRQKREEYGVTQTRLAVACGISREYYNRIEKGKQPLNDELREQRMRITKEYRKLRYITDLLEKLSNQQE